MKMLWIFIIGIALVDIYYLLTWKKDNPTWGYRSLNNKDLDVIRDNIMMYNGREFEVFIAELYGLLGHKVELTPQSNDGGKDLIIDKEIYIECKAWHNDSQPGREHMQKLMGSCAADGIKKAWFISLNGFNDNAFKYAKQINKRGDFVLSLYDIDYIMNMVKKVNTSELLRRMGYGFEQYATKIS